MSRGQAVLAGGSARPGLEPSLAKEGAQGKRPPASLGVDVAKERLGDRVKQPHLDPRGNWHGPSASAERGSDGERLWEQWLRVRFSLVHNRREITRRRRARQTGTLRSGRCDQREERDSEPYDMSITSRTICMTTCQVASPHRIPIRSLAGAKYAHTMPQLLAR